MINVGRIQPQNVDSNKQHKTKNKGFIRASMAQSAVATAVTLPSIAIPKLMKKVGKLNAEENMNLAYGIGQGMTKSGLRDKGVEFVVAKTFDRQPKTVKEVMNSVMTLFSESKPEDQKVIDVISKASAKLFDKAAKKDPQFAKIIETPEFKRGLALPSLFQLKLGINAFFTPVANAIVVPDKGVTASAFHEMGHAMNANFSKIGKALQKVRGAGPIAASIIAFIALTNKKKVSDASSPTDSKIQKGRDFIKKNAGKLSFLAFLPMVAEEAMASAKGQKLAKGLVDSKVFKKALATHALGLASYTMAAVATGISAMAAVKVKDNIQAKYEHKQALKYAK